MCHRFGPAAGGRLTPVRSTPLLFAVRLLICTLLLRTYSAPTPPLNRLYKEWSNYGIAKEEIGCQ
jgi:hypothetical protein